LASTLLGEDVGDIGNGVFYVVTLFSALLVSAPMVSVCGSKWAMIASMAVYCIYIACFALAVVFKHAAILLWTIFLFGSVCGGLAAGALWTAQGGYFTESSSLLAEANGAVPEETTSSLSGSFAAIFLIGEVGCKLIFSALQKLGLQPWVISLLFSALGVLATLGMTQTHDFKRDRNGETTVSSLHKVFAVVSLWRDPMIWLLSPTNLAFGFAAAFMNSYANSTFVVPELGVDLVSSMAAVTAFVAAVLSPVWGAISKSLGKGPTIIAGAICFFSISCCVLVLGCCSGWGWGLILLYILQGSGRAVYESTNRALFADFFPPPETEGAFANCMFQSSCSFALGFFLQTVSTGQSLAAIVMCMSVLMPVDYRLALALQQRRRRKREQALLQAASLDYRTHRSGQET